MRGIGLKVAAVAVFVVMAGMLKAAEGVPTGELVFFRSFFAIFPIALYLGWRGQLVEGLKTANPWGHVVRGLVGVTAMTCNFFAIARLPLPEATAIGYATPLLIVALSALLLKEFVRLYRWSAVVVGLVGVLIIMWPRLTLLSGEAPVEAGVTAGAVAAFGGAICAAFATLQVRRLVATEKTATIVIYFSLTSSILALLTVPLGWVWPTPTQAALLIGAGFAGGIAQILLTSSYRHADMSIIAPFEYTSMLLAIAVGYFAFAEVPTVQMLFGGLIVVGSGIFVIWRERRLGLDRGKARQTMTPQG
ncbi:DMT family transporter [Devosia nitrariae]|uniref:Membrane protein n=1 Tax=Devosia nitrariae TaxID=2071872 RepID=A0ABQ5VZH3_9HYPH|nr:DMT family transporter [Devosia nitrariae]GLQ52998.1 membrane protein [Devosia nitrariae]